MVRCVVSADYSADVLTWGELQNDAGLRASELEKYKATATGMWTYVNEAVGCECFGTSAALG